MNFWQKIDAWFTPERRQAIYGGVAAIAPALVGIGVLSDAQTEAILVIVAAVLQAGAGLLAILHLTPAEVGTWLQTTGRAVIYALAAAVAPAAVVLGFVTEATSVNILTVISLILTIISSILGVFMVSKEQKA